MPLGTDAVWAAARLAAGTAAGAGWYALAREPKEHPDRVRTARRPETTEPSAGDGTMAYEKHTENRGTMHKISQPKLSPGNHIYLYRLLRDAIGAGKQTLMPNVEDALEAEQLGARDLGFESTRDLLEALDDFIKLTVFKGGRIYATVIAQPAWDEALAAPAKQPTGGSAKSWKRKKADKSLKPVKPKRVKREQPTAKPATVDEAPAAPVEPDAAEAPDAASVPEGADPSLSTPAEHADGAEPAGSAEATEEPADAKAAGGEDGSEAAGQMTAETADRPEEATSQAADHEPEPPQPSISLTVIYDPENANGGVTTLESTPGASRAADETGSIPAEANVATGETGACKGAVADTQGAAGAAGSPAADACGRDENEPDAPARGNAQPASETAVAANGPSSIPELTATSSPAAADEAAAPADAPASSSASPASAPEADSPVAGCVPSEAAPAPVPAHAAAPAPVPAPAPAPEQPGIPTARMLAAYPEDFSCEVYCPSALLGVAMGTLPLGTSAMDALCAAYGQAREDETIRGTRTRFTFELPMDNGCSVLVEVRRKGGHGSDWAVQSLTYSVKG